MPILVGSRKVRTKQWEQHICDTIPSKNELLRPEFHPAFDGIPFGGHRTTGSKTTSIDDKYGKDLDILLYVVLCWIIRMVFGKTTREGLPQGSNGNEM